ncbi:hypothetical protein BIY23_04545 [Wolbachia pipientis]|uniref:Uncharacterized protein n=1 Tax=Wolbachia pipientis TaxID=955 RepID=A0A1E7QKE4_WOLPI|nr:ankyrin repeat domain-containing protein [Wolbachia pipientis]OEY86867.1 hypothetical protein BIY23_04545 [Wolbachia pipientis]
MTSNTVDRDGRTPLHNAIIHLYNNGNYNGLNMSIVGRKIDELIKKGVDVNMQDNNGETPLHFAIKYNKLTEYRGGDSLSLPNKFIHRTYLVKDIIDNSTAINTSLKDNNNNTYVHLAIKHSTSDNKHDIDIIKYFIEKTDDINEKNNDGDTPLHIAAAKHGLQDIVECLIQKGADINEQNNNGDTPLHIAAKHGLQDIVKCLIQKDADINEQNNNGDTPLHIAAKHGLQDIVECLIQKGADINIVNNDQHTPLHMAIYSQNKDLVKFLIQEGTDINALNYTDYAYKLANEHKYEPGHNYANIASYLDDLYKANDSSTISDSSVIIGLVGAFVCLVVSFIFFWWKTDSSSYYEDNSHSDPLSFYDDEPEFSDDLI